MCFSSRGRFYPGTGHHMECGVEGGEGYTVNVPWLEGGMTDGDYLAAMQQVILPIAYEYAPDLLIVSAGFDAAVNDPIGGCFVTPQGFAHMTSLLMVRTCCSRCVCVVCGDTLQLTVLTTDRVLPPWWCCWKAATT